MSFIEDTQKCFEGDFSDCVFDWRKLNESLKASKAAWFPHGCIVLVNAPRYKGYGLAVNNDDVPADQCAVLLENGNTWHYPIETVTPVPKKDYPLLPPYVRRQKLAHHGKHPVRTLSNPKLP
jgi:hypothetical protein